MRNVTTLIFGLLVGSSVLYYSRALVHAADSTHPEQACPCSPPVLTDSTKTYAPAHGFASHHNAIETVLKNIDHTEMRTAGGYGGYGAPSYGGPTYAAGYGGGASHDVPYESHAPDYSSHHLTYVPVHPKKLHSGLVVTCQPNLAGYAHGFGGVGYGSSGAHAGYLSPGIHKPTVYRTSSGYSRPYSHISYQAPAPTYHAPAYSAQAYSSPAYSPPAYNPPAYSAPEAVYKAPSYPSPAPVHSSPYASTGSSYSASSYSAPAPSYNAPYYSPSAPTYGAPVYAAPPSYGVTPEYNYRAANEDTNELNNKKVIETTKPNVKNMEVASSNRISDGETMTKQDA